MATKKVIRGEKPKPPSGIQRRSGNVGTQDKMVAFLYLLMRDHLPTGEVAEIVMDLEKRGGSYNFSNGWLAKYAVDLTKRLYKKPKAK
jgi:hypothetical protein